MGILVVSDRDFKRMSIQLKGINAAIDQLFQQGATLMGLSEDLNAKVDRAEAALTGIGADIRALKDAVKPAITEAEAEALKAKLEALAARAEGIDAETPPA